MKTLILGGLAALAIGLTGCSVAAEAQPLPEKQHNKPVGLVKVNVYPAPAQTNCIMFIPGTWTCPERVAAP